MKRRGRKPGERSAALERGDARYFTGRPCRRGHVGERYTKSQHCVVCTKADNDLHDRERHGLPEPTRSRPETCECCGRKPGKKGLALDHDHETGAFRGWLCMLCNTGIGKLGDNLLGLLQAVRYLQGEW